MTKSRSLSTKNVIKAESTEQKQFTQNILTRLTCVLHNSSSGNIEEIYHETSLASKALNPNGALQEMLVAQMISIHQLQQNAVAFATKSSHPESVQYFTNAAIKLANCFTQQVNTLSKLQGHMNQKITVEQVDVHDGGQAIVGNVIKK